MKKEFLTARVQGDTLLYYLYSFGGHVARVSPYGKISRASDEDRRAAQDAERWLKAHKR